MTYPEFREEVLSNMANEMREMGFFPDFTLYWTDEMGKIMDAARAYKEPDNDNQGTT